MSAPDPRDPWYVPAPREVRPFLKRVALSLAPDGMQVDPAVKDALQAAARMLEAAGWQVVDTPCPSMRDAARINAILWMAEMQNSAAGMIAREAESDSQFVFDMMSRDAGHVDMDGLMTALQNRATLLRTWETYLETCPLVLCPVSGALPFDQQRDVASAADFEQIFEDQLTQRALPGLGLPGLCVATGQARERPVGVQLVAGRYREDILLSAGAVLEAACGAPQVCDPA